jgi:hypothetical protein
VNVICQVWEKDFEEFPNPILSISEENRCGSTFTAALVFGETLYISEKIPIIFCCLNFEEKNHIKLQFLSAELESRHSSFFSFS